MKFSDIIKKAREKNLGRKGIKRRIKNIRKTEYGKYWQDVEKGTDGQWYAKDGTSFFYNGTVADMHPLTHEDFLNFIKSKDDIKTVLEVGCGDGFYPIKFKNLFENKEYLGLDIGEPAINFCKENSNFNFICDDFIKMESSKKYDLIFSHAVIDHVYDIDSFLSRIVTSCKKYAYISAYRGYFPDLEDHKMHYDNSRGTYRSNLSAKKIKEVLVTNGLSQDEFSIKGQKDGILLDQPYSKGLTGISTIIKIERKPNSKK